METKDAYLYLFSLDFWHSCSFESEYTVGVESGMEKTIIITANEKMDVEKLTAMDFAKASKRYGL